MSKNRVKFSRAVAVFPWVDAEAGQFPDISALSLRDALVCTDSSRGAAGTANAPLEQVLLRRQRRSPLGVDIPSRRDTLRNGLKRGGIVRQGFQVVVVMDEAGKLRLREGDAGDHSEDVDEGSDLFLSPLDDVSANEYRQWHHHQEGGKKPRVFRQVNHYRQFSLGDLVLYPMWPRVDLSPFRKGHRLLIDGAVRSVPQRISLIFRRGLFFIGDDYRSYVDMPMCPYLVHYRQLCQLNGLRPQPLPLGRLGRLRRFDVERERPHHHSLFGFVAKKHRAE